MGGRMRLSIVGVAGFTVVALVVVAVQLLSGGRQGARAKPVPRRGLVAVPDKPAALNRPAVLKTFSRTRAEVKAPALAGSGCLDAAAASLVASFDAGAVSGSAPNTCGRIDWGWVAGSDRSGVQQAQAAYGRTPVGRHH